MSPSVPGQSPKRSRTPQPPSHHSSSSQSSHASASSSSSSSHQHHPNPRAASPSYSQSSSSGSLSNLGSSSTVSHRRQTILSPFIDDEFDQQEEEEVNHPVEFVESEHDFQPLGNPTYLSFRRRQIIKVFNKDPSGWWDGELEGRRGWFPSNYVNTPSRIDISSEPMSRQTSGGQSSSATSESARSWTRRPSEASSNASSSGASHPSAWKHKTNPTSPLFSSQSLAGPSKTPARNSNRRMIHSTPESIMAPIIHAIALLENAVAANRVTHFQPSTACVISSIRSVLSATDCLTKESPLLRTEPVLARERKQVLSELSRLVAQARRASGPMPNEGARGPEMASMLRMSSALLENVRRFLDAAVNCGVELPERRGNQMGMSEDEEEKERLQELEKTPTPGSPKQSTAFGRASPGPNRRLQAAFRQREPASLTIRVKSMANLRTQRRTSEELEQTSDSEAGAPSPHYDRSRRVRPFPEDVSSRRGHLADSIDSSSTGESSWESPSGPLTPNPLAADENGNIDALASVKISHEHLLSIVAAFIGHIHSHSASSHPSSHAHLLDVTRECIDNVRELLTVVEAVSFHREIREARPIDVSQLEIAGASLYEATAHLVASAEAVASLPFNSTSADQDDEERARLLHGATGTLRTAADCVQLVTRCVTRARGLPDFLVRLDQQQRRPSMSEEVDPDATPRRTKQVGQRDANTLSSLGRKATTISSLRKQYDEEPLEEMVDGAPVSHVGEEESVERFASAEDAEETTPHVSARGSQESTVTSSTSSSSQTFKSAVSSRMEQIRTSGSERAGSPFRISDPTEGSLALSTNSTSTDESLRTSYEGSEHGKVLVKVASSGASSPAFAEDSEARRSLSIDHKHIPLVPSVLETPIQLERVRPRSSSIPSRPQPVPMAKSSTEIPSTSSGDARHWVVSHDYHPTDIAYSTEGQIVGGTLAVLVEKMTPHDSTVDPTFQATFYLTFRLFTSPTLLLAELLRRYDLTPPPGMVLGPAEQLLWMEHKVLPVRLRIYNFLKTWLDVHWQAATDSIVLPHLLAFAKTTMPQTLPGMAPRLIESITRRKIASNLPLPGAALSRTKSSDILRGGIPMRERSSSVSNQPPPTPLIARGLMNKLSNQTASTNLGITDFDATELARQLTIMESKLYNVIKSEDLLQSGKKASPSLKAMSTFSNQITGFVSEVILNELDQKKRTALIKFFVKLTTRLVDLQNYSGAMTVLAALNGSSITRLKKTWEALPNKYKNSLHSLRALFDVSRNHASYRARLRETCPPALPYLGIILTDLTFCNDGNQDTRPAPLAPEKALINVSKFYGLTKLVGDFEKYQVPFTLAEVPEVQVFLTKILAEKGSGSSSIENLYRKSLLIEPRSTRDTSNPYRV